MTDHYAVIGNPIAHSKSPALHACFARQCGEDLRYGAILGGLDQFNRCAQSFFDDGGQGLNITAPFKLEAFTLADQLTERARLAGAVNTLKREGQGLLGDNTDGAGLVRDLREQFGLALAGRRILIVGAGGATRGVLHPLLAEHPARIAIANKTLAKARALQLLVVDIAPIDVGHWSDFSGQPFDLVINASSASVHGGVTPLPAGLFAAGALAYDMSYGLASTPFMNAALARGAARVGDGFGMLACQAAESFLLWRGVLPDIVPVMNELRANWR